MVDEQTRRVDSRPTATPSVDRQVVLHLKGDGTANLHRICGWIGEQVINRSGPGSKAASWNGSGMLENVLAVANGEVDVAVATPACAVALACAGRIAGVPPMAHLRALGTLPQYDRLVFAVRSDLGVCTFDDLRDLSAPLRISAWPDDHEAFIGIGARVLLNGVGLGEPELQRRGGEIVEFPSARTARPGEAWHDRVFGPIRSGAADAVIMEAIMVQAWRDLATDPGLCFLSLGDDDVKRIESSHGWPIASLPGGYFPGQQGAVRALEFSDFLVMCRDDLPRDLGHLIAWSMGETRAVIEAQYRHLPPERSPLTYPLDPHKMARTTIPLHLGAAEYYEQLA